MILLLGVHSIWVFINTLSTRYALLSFMSNMNLAFGTLSESNLYPQSHIHTHTHTQAYLRWNSDYIKVFLNNYFHDLRLSLFIS